MVRTQVYLTEEEREGLDSVAESTGKKHAELIREALDSYLDLAQGSRRTAILSRAAGMWKNRRDLPDFAAVRHSWDRR